MKFVKSISLFVVYPLLTAMLGFFGGFELARFFYPEQEQQLTIQSEYVQDDASGAYHVSAADAEESGVDEKEPDSDVEEEISDTELKEVSSLSETLSVDTEYVLEEMDVSDSSSVETVWRLPAKYVGMNREQFLEAMELYEAFPPLSEMERGFVGLEVLSFSRERVVVQMNYQYVQPSKSFYLAVKDNEVVVYLEDQETLYLYTGIELDKLPEALQLQIMQMLWVENEESLYDFLEAYSS
ncbi:MAG: hypothetical protein IJ833_09880 [Lachnospiraceae bacterium]|nr:hypothetical protein [Lachnospiraceae bacterium]